MWTELDQAGCTLVVRHVAKDTQLYYTLTLLLPLLFIFWGPGSFWDLLFAFFFSFASLALLTLGRRYHIECFMLHALLRLHGIVRSSPVDRGGLGSFKALNFGRTVTSGCGNRQ